MGGDVMKKSLFYRLAMTVYKKSCIKKLPLFTGRRIEADLIQLHPGENLECVKADYYVHKLALFITILLVGALFAAVAELNARMTVSLKGEALERGSPGEEEAQIDIEAFCGGNRYDFKVRLAARQPGKEEAEQRMEEVIGVLPELILGENPDLDSVTSGLRLLEAYEPYPVTVEWESGRPELVSGTGEIEAVEQPEKVSLKALLSCGEYSREEILELTLLPEVISGEEKVRRELEHYLAEAEKGSREEEAWQLPQIWNGQEISWKQKRSNKSLMLFTGAVAAAVLVYYTSDYDLHTRLEKRKKALIRDYPDLVHELVLLIGAGMTIRGAFRKIAVDYEKKKSERGKVSLAYEEVLYTCREMQSGIAEGAAYERFGKRTGLQQYVRLSSLLSQNLKRGNNMLPERLREEAYKAGEERLQQGKRLGEEAGTRLLVPMVMMLAVAMLLIMIPAFSTL